MSEMTSSHISVGSQTLYVMYDSDDVCLYVGRTNRFLSRIAKHGAKKDWWTEVSYTKMFRCNSSDELAQLEKEAIRQFNPKYNIVRYGHDYIPPRDQPERDLELLLGTLQNPSECVIQAELFTTSDSDLSSAAATFCNSKDITVEDFTEFLYWTIQTEKEFNAKGRIAICDENGEWLPKAKFCSVVERDRNAPRHPLIENFLKDMVQ